MMVSRREIRAAKPNEYLETIGSKSTRHAVDRKKPTPNGLANLINTHLLPTTRCIQPF
jgi:hypothetical protein